MLALSTSVPAFAAGETTIDSQIEKEISSESITSVLENNAEIDPTCPWTADTKVQEKIPTYDLDNQVNGYILNLSTNGADTGYLVYDISSGKPVLMEFGYEGVYSIQGKEVTKESELSQSKLIPIGMNEYVLQKGNDLYTIQTNIKVTDQKEKIQQILEEKKTNIPEYVQSEQMTFTVPTRAQEIYTSVAVPNLWSSGYTPLSSKDLLRTGISKPIGCAPVCGINMLLYWQTARGISIYNPNDLKTVYDKLATCMNINASGGVKFSQAFDGMGNYLKSNSRTAPKGNDIKTIGWFGGFSFDWLKTQLNNGNALYLSADSKSLSTSGTSSDHAFFAVGYQLTSTGDFIRVGTGWDNSLSHFFNWSAFSNDVYGAWYYRW